MKDTDGKKDAASDFTYKYYPGANSSYSWEKWSFRTVEITRNRRGSISVQLPHS